MPMLSSGSALETYKQDRANNRPSDPMMKQEAWREVMEANMAEPAMQEINQIPDIDMRFDVMDQYEAAKAAEEAKEETRPQGIEGLMKAIGKDVRGLMN